MVGLISLSLEASYCGFIIESLYFDKCAAKNEPLIFEACATSTGKEAAKSSYSNKFKHKGI